MGLHGTPGLVDQRQDLLAIADKHLARRADAQPPARTGKQRGAQLTLQLFDPGGDIRRHAMQLLSRQRDAAALCHRLDHTQLAKLHGSLLMITEIFIYHLS